MERRKFLEIIALASIYSCDLKKVERTFSKTEKTITIDVNPNFFASNDAGTIDGVQCYKTQKDKNTIFIISGKTSVTKRVYEGLRTIELLDTGEKTSIGKIYSLEKMIYSDSTKTISDSLKTK